MRKSTIKLTKHELDFARDTIYPETKHAIMIKMQELFTECGQKLNQNIHYQTISNGRNFKITRGEQYRNMPYLVLDCPQIKGQGFDWVARTMFWWGHYISCNLILRSTLITDASFIAKLKKTYLLTGGDLWEQDLRSAAYRKVSELSTAEIEDLLKYRDYLKLSRKIPIRRYQELPALANEIYSEWLLLLVQKKGAY